jgi:hypothetical protein
MPNNIPFPLVGEWILSLKPGKFIFQALIKKESFSFESIPPVCLNELGHQDIRLDS